MHFVASAPQPEVHRFLRIRDTVVGRIALDGSTDPRAAAEPGTSHGDRPGVGRAIGQTIRGNQRAVGIGQRGSQPIVARALDEPLGPHHQIAKRRLHVERRSTLAFGTGAAHRQRGGRTVDTSQRYPLADDVDQPAHRAGTMQQCGRTAQYLDLARIQRVGSYPVIGRYA